jgi:hypothetical protein
VSQSAVGNRQKLTFANGAASLYDGAASQTTTPVPAANLSALLAGTISVPISGPNNAVVGQVYYTAYHANDQYFVVVRGVPTGGSTVSNPGIVGMFIMDPANP